MKGENPIHAPWANKAAAVVRGIPTSLYHDESPLGDAALALSAISFIQGFIDDTVSYISDIPVCLGIRSVMAVFAR